MKVDIKTAAKKHGVTLVELSERLGVTRQAVHYYIEQGDKNPLAQLARIAGAIGCSVSELFTEGDENVFRCPHCGGRIVVDKE